MKGSRHDSVSGHFRIRDDGILLSVRLTPRSSRDAIEGVGTLADGTAVVTVRVRAVPEKNAANRALEKLLAKRFGVAGGAVSVTGGQTARLKTVTLEGDPKALAAVARELAGP